MRVVRAGADFVELASKALFDSLTGVLEKRPRASLALSGGSTPWPILRRLAEADLDWSRVDVYQVDERIAPAGDPARNLAGLRTALLDHVSAKAHPMPVEATDVERAADRYARELPEPIDVVHLGLGDDGHTASLVPGDRVLAVSDRRVAVTAPYRGHRRMTLTYRALEDAGAIVWIVSGRSKARAVERLIAADPTIPAGQVPSARATLVTNTEDRA